MKTTLNHDKKIILPSKPSSIIPLPPLVLVNNNELTGQFSGQMMKKKIKNKSN